MSIKKMLCNYQPREKTTLFGIDSLSDSELLALFIRTGTPSHNAIMIAMEILKEFGGFIGLSKATIKDLMAIKGIGKTKAIEIKGIFEISSRIENKNNIKQITSHKVAANIACKIIGKKDVEHFMVIFINNKKEILFQKIIYIGTESAIFINPKDIIALALKIDAKEFYCFHNHPSGNVMPSKDDILTTKRLIHYSSLFNLKFLGHIIVNSFGNYHKI